MGQFMYLVQTDKIDLFTVLANQYGVSFVRQPLVGVEVNDTKVSAFYVRRRDYRFHALLQDAEKYGIKFWFEGYIS